MLRGIVLFFLVFSLSGCVSPGATATSTPPPPTLPIATGIPVTPTTNATRAAQTAAPTSTVETLPTPENTSAMFQPLAALFKIYQPPDSDPKPLYDALANGVTQFLNATSNSDVSLEGQPALDQLATALGQIPNLPQNTKPQVVAIHVGDDQGGSRDLVFCALQGLMGMPVLGIERLGGTYNTLAPISFQPFNTPDARYFFPGDMDTHDMTGDGIKELIYTIEYPGGSGSTNDVTMARWDEEQKQLKTLFHASLINWAGESDYQIENAADATSIQLTFPWFGAFDHKLLAHPTATQSWEYDDRQDKFVRVTQTIAPPTTPREELNAAEYAFRNGDLAGAADLYHKAWTDSSLQKEDFNSAADPAAFAKFREAMVLGLLGKNSDAIKLLSDVQRSGDALKTVVAQYVKNNKGQDGTLRGWIGMANARDLDQLIYESKAGNLDFPFEAQEVYAEGAIVSSYLNTHGGADKNPDAIWQALSGLGFQPVQHAAVDLDGNGVNEFLVVTQEGGNTPNKTQVLWFIYQLDNAWRVRAIDTADTLEFQGDAVPLPSGKGQAIKIKLPDTFEPNQTALTWDGTRIIWLDATTLKPSDASDDWSSVGGGVLEDDF